MSPQQTIAHYRLTSQLGEGGMGIVYRAVDTKLGREVAIKILPAAFANRMARLAREARVLAALNHPNLAAIYGVEEGALATCWARADGVGETRTLFESRKELQLGNFDIFVRRFPPPTGSRSTEWQISTGCGTVAGLVADRPRIVLGRARRANAGGPLYGGGWFLRRGQTTVLERQTFTRAGQDKWQYLALRPRAGR